MKTLVGPIVVLIVLLGILFLLFSFTHVRAPFFMQGHLQGNAEMTVVQLYADSDAYTVHAEYPQFGIPAVDAVIKSHVEKAVADLEAQPQNPHDSATPKNEFTGTFDSVSVGPDIISVELLLSEYTGGAHPNTVVEGVNVVRATGKEVTFDEVIKMTGLTLQQISDSAKQQLQQKLGDGFQFKDGADPKPENYSTFLISANAVTFVFNDYQVAAYVEGPQRVTFERKQ